MCGFFFKQKTAYAMRISDWSSDVCSSDLQLLQLTLSRVARSGDVQDETGEAPGAGLDREPGQLLQRLDGVGVRQPRERARRLGLQRHIGTNAPHVEREVAVDVGDVEQLLEVGGRDAPQNGGASGREKR